MYLEEDIWKNISNYLFSNDKNNGNKFIEKVQNFIYGKIEDLNVLNNYSKKILYTDYVNLLIKFNLTLRKKYLSNLVNLFREYDVNRTGVISDDQFKDLIIKCGLFNSNDEYEFDNIYQELIEHLDSEGHNKITFSDIVNCFDKLEVIDEKSGKNIKALDKIAMMNVQEE